MIVDVLLGWIASLAEAALAMWPSWQPAWPQTAEFASYLDDINYLLPLDVVFTAVFAVLVIGVPLAATSISLWLVALIRGGSSRG